MNDSSQATHRCRWSSGTQLLASAGRENSFTGCDDEDAGVDVDSVADKDDDAGSVFPVFFGRSISLLAAFLKYGANVPSSYNCQIGK